MKGCITVAVMCLLLASAGQASGQREEADTARWQFNSTLSMRLNSGNIDRFILTPEANIGHISKNRKIGFSSRQRYTYGYTGTPAGRLLTENDVLSRNFFYLMPEARLYPYLMAWFQRHQRQRLDFRYQVGPGVTLALLQYPERVVKLSLTATYEQNKYAEPELTYLEDSTQTRYSTFRATVRLFSSANISPATDLYFEGLYQQALSRAKDGRVFIEAGMNVKVTGILALRTNINYEYQQVHVLTEKPYDLLLNVGLNIKIQSKT